MLVGGAGKPVGNPLYYTRLVRALVSPAQPMVVRYVATFPQNCGERDGRWNTRRSIAASVTMPRVPVPTFVASVIGASRMHIAPVALARQRARLTRDGDSVTTGTVKASAYHARLHEFCSMNIDSLCDAAVPRLSRHMLPPLVGS
jgi:hypothetical protein